MQDFVELIFLQFSYYGILSSFYVVGFCLVGFCPVFAKNVCIKNIIDDHNVQNVFSRSGD